MKRDPEIRWDSNSFLATFDGPGGFVQVMMTYNKANAIALALDITFKVETIA